MSWRGLPPPAAETAASAVYLAIDIGHDRLAAGIVNDYGEVLVRDRVANPLRDAWPALQRLIRRVVAARPEDAGALLACGVTCEGPIDKDDGTVHPLHMPGLAGFALRERVHELTRLPTVLATSAQARVLAERWIGAARGAADVMVLLLADTVEAGIVSNGASSVDGAATPVSSVTSTSSRTASPVSVVLAAACGRTRRRSRCKPSSTVRCAGRRPR
jgi:glucokinase